MEKDIEEQLSSTGRLLDPEEDIHSVVESRLGARVGAAALRLHTARSRNDQSATDTRLWMLASIPALDIALQQLIEVLLRLERIIYVRPGLLPHKCWQHQQTNERQHCVVATLALLKK